MLSITDKYGYLMYNVNALLITFDRVEQLWFYYKNALEKQEAYDGYHKCNIKKNLVVRY